MRNVVLCLIFNMVVLSIHGQAVNDSLYNVWKDPTVSDSVRARAFEGYIWKGYIFTNPDTALLLADELMAFSEERKWLDGQITALDVHAVVNAMKGDHDIALELNAQILEMAGELGDQQRIGGVFRNMGIIYNAQGNLPMALDYYQKSLVINEKMNDLRGMAGTLVSMGVIHREMGNLDKALNDNLRSLEIAENLDEPMLLSQVLSSAGNVYFIKKDFPHALEFHERCLSIKEDLGDQLGISMCMVNIGNVYYEQNEFIHALDFYQQALALQERIGDRKGLSKSYNQIGLIKLKQEDLNQALDQCTKGLELARSLNSVYDVLRNSECLYQVYKTMGDQRNALYHFEQMVLMQDSLYNEENTKKITQLEMQYEFDKKEAAAEAEQEKKDAIATQELRREKLVRNGFMGGFAVVLLFAGVFFMQRNRISKEKQRSEELLLNILPEETAQELKEKGHSDAQLIDQVTVLFTDFKGFTALSEKVTPKELVADLHECFSAFDNICEKYGIEKIKTIGDAYMAAGGLPSPNNTHAQDVVKAALEMAEVVEKGKANKIAAGLPFFEIRIGVHTGPVVAGIVGVKKFQYDIWGDTVNTASRMESSGEAGKVNISHATYQLVKDAFHCEYRGEIEAKGKGKMRMYFIEHL